MLFSYKINMGFEKLWLVALVQAWFYFKVTHRKTKTPTHTKVVFAAICMVAFGKVALCL